MANKLNFDSKSLLNFKFSPKQKGYDPLEVDEVFDKIILDYDLMSLSLKKLTTDNEKNKAKIKELKDSLSQKELELASINKKLESLQKKSSINDDNYKLITKIAAYERVLHRKGVNLKKALSDPDNC